MLYSYIVLPLLIIFARILDVSLGTMRIILISKGLKKFAPIIGFFEVLIWIIVVKQIITDINSPIAYFAYAFGYAMGTYIGIFIEEKLSLGRVMIRIITPDDSSELEELLRSNKLGLTSITAKGKDGMVKIIISILNRKELNQNLKILNDYDPELFYTIEDVHTVNKGFFGINAAPITSVDKIQKIFSKDKMKK